MSADWSKPTNSSTYVNYTAEVTARDADLAVGLDPAVVTPTNLPANAVRWNSANHRWEKYDGVSTWSALDSSYAINISGTAGAVAFSAITGKPTTLAGYGITDGQPLDSDLTALAGLSTTGVVVRTGAGTATTRSIVGPAAGITVTNGDGVAGNPTLALANDLNALEALAGTGLAVRSATSTWVQRSIQQPAAGITVTNGDGVAGNPTLALANDLSALEALAGTGVAVRTAGDTWAQRSIVGPAAGITVTNGDGVAGNPTLALANDLSAVEGLSTTGAVQRTATDTWTAGTLPVGSGGTGLTTFTAKGALPVATAAATLTAKQVGADGSVLVADSSQADGLVYVQLGAGDVRQSVLSSAVDSNGYAAGVVIGTGLAVNLDASPTPMVLTFASGFGARGAQDLVSVLSADATGIVSGLAASNTSFVYADWSNGTSVTWGKASVPPRYGYAFDRQTGVLLNFEGTNGATATTDDFGNPVVLTGATISTAQKKFGSSSLDCSGGTAKSARITFPNTFIFPSGAWEFSFWFYAVAFTGGFQTLAAFTNAGGHGVRVDLDASNQLRFTFSTDGSNDAYSAAAAGGLSTATWYKMRVVYDPLTTTYKVYKSVAGAAETLIHNATQLNRVCAVQYLDIGRDLVSGGLNQFNGYIDALRFVACATNTSAETPSASAPAITDYPYHFFSIPEMKMYEVTGASSSSGTNPTMTQRNRLFIAEADTNGSAVTAVRNYALRGKYISPLTVPPAVSTRTAFNHNIGVEPRIVRAWAMNVNYDNGWTTGDRTLAQTDYFNGSSNHTLLDPMQLEGRNTAYYAANNYYPLAAQTPKTAPNTFGSSNRVNWMLEIEAERGW